MEAASHVDKEFRLISSMPFQSGRRFVIEIKVGTRRRSGHN